MRKLRHLSPQAARLLTIGLVVCDALLAAAVVLLLQAGPYSIAAHRTYILAEHLEKLELAVLFITVFAASFVEEQVYKT